MTAFNIVRFRVKPGHEEHSSQQHRGLMRGTFKGFRGGRIVRRTARDTCCSSATGHFAKFADGDGRR